MNAFTYRYFLFPLRSTYRKIFRPKTKGVKVIIRHKDEILLIKNTYGNKKWNLPGGGVKRKENFAQAAKREVKEEIGIKLVDVKRIGSFLNEKEYIRDTVTVFTAKVENKNIRLDKKEIKEAQWFLIKKLPQKEECTDTLIQSLQITKILPS